MVDHLLDILVEDFLNSVVDIFSGLLNVIPALLHSSVELSLDLDDFIVNILLELLGGCLILGTKINNSVVEDVLDVVRGFKCLLLGKLATGDLLLTVNSLPGLIDVGEILLNLSLVVAVALKSLSNLLAQDLKRSRLKISRVRSGDTLDDASGRLHRDHSNGLHVRDHIIDALLDIAVKLLEASIDLGLGFLEALVDLSLHFIGLGVNILLELSGSLFSSGLCVSDGVVDNVSDVVCSLLGLLLSELSTDGLLLGIKSLPVGARGLEPLVDDLLVVAVADQSVLNLASDLFDHAGDILLRVEVVINGAGALVGGIASLELQRNALEDNLSVDLLAHGAHGSGDADLVKVEGLRLGFALGDHLGEELLDLGVGVLEALAIDEGVVGNEVDDILGGLDIELVSFSLDSLSLGHEVVPWLGDGGLVALPGVDPLLVDGSISIGSGCLPGISSSAGIVERDLGKVELWEIKLVAALIVELEEVLNGGLGLGVSGVGGSLGSGEGCDHGSGESVFHGEKV